MWMDGGMEGCEGESAGVFPADGATFIGGKYMNVLMPGPGIHWPRRRVTSLVSGACATGWWWWWWWGMYRCEHRGLAGRAVGWARMVG
jgi:hypothetical protein